MSNFIVFLDHLSIVENYILQSNSNFKALKYFTKVSKQRLANLKSFLNEYSKMKGGFLGRRSWFKGDAIALLSKKIASTVGIIKVLDLKNDSDKIQETLEQRSLYTFKVKEFIFDEENLEEAILKLSLPINFLSELSKINF